MTEILSPLQWNLV